MPSDTRDIGTISAPACPVCGGSGPTVMSDLVDWLFGAPGRWTYRRCQTCGSLWLDPRPRAEDLEVAYRGYHTHGASEATVQRAPWAKRLLHLLPGHRDDPAGEIAYLEDVPPGRVLDVGCGDGRTLRALAARGWNTTGVDTDPVATAQARALGTVGVVDGTIEDVRATGDRFDAVTAAHVIEHVDDPAGLLTSAHNLLRPGGIISLVTPNAASWRQSVDGDSWRGLEPPRHLQILTLGAITQLATRVGFSSIEARTSTRGTNGMIRAARAQRRAERTGRAPVVTSLDYALGELVQARAALRRRRDPYSGEELVLRAVRT